MPGKVLPVTLLVKNCHLCMKACTGFYCVYHTKKRNEYERAKRRMLKARKEAFIMNAQKGRSL